MRKQAFSHHVKRLALPTARQRVMPGQSLAACDAGGKNTAFLRRDRFPKQVARHRALSESGIVETDENLPLKSFNGRRRLPRPVRRRGGAGGIRSGQSRKKHH